MKPQHLAQESVEKRKLTQASKRKISPGPIYKRGLARDPWLVLGMASHFDRCPARGVGTRVKPRKHDPHHHARDEFVRQLRPVQVLGFQEGLEHVGMAFSLAPPLLHRFHQEILEPSTGLIPFREGIVRAMGIHNRRGRNRKLEIVEEASKFIRKFLPKLRAHQAMGRGAQDELLELLVEVLLALVLPNRR